MKKTIKKKKTTEKNITLRIDQIDRENITELVKRVNEAYPHRRISINTTLRGLIASSKTLEAELVLAGIRSIIV